MKTYDVIVIGASAAGITAAITLRKYDAHQTIAVLTDVANVPIPCGIPYIYGTVGDPMKNLVPVQQMAEANHLDLIVDKVIKINRDFNLVLTGSNQSYEYKKLVLANGSNPIIPPIEGINLGNVYVIRKDPVYLKTVMEKLDTVQDLAIIGGGFIGAEMAEECKKRNPNLTISIIEMQQHCLQLVYDLDMVEKAEKALSEQGIQLLTNEKVVKITGKNGADTVVLASGKTVKADMILLCIGCSANIQLAQEAGLKIGPTRSVWVDETMKTSDPAIYACGDVCEKVSFFDQKPSNLKLASIATAEARVVGANLAGKSRVMSGVIGCFSTFIGKQTFSAAGLTEAQAIAKGYEVVVGQAESVNRHPGMMPGAQLMKVKLIFNKANGVIIGGEIYGAVSGGELINALSVCISSKLTAEQLATFQAATHPALTASPIAYQLVNAAEMANLKLQ